MASIEKKPARQRRAATTTSVPAVTPPIPFALSRGDIVLLDTSTEAEVRIAVIVQPSLLDALPSVLVCPVHTTPIDVPLLRIRVGLPDRVTSAGLGWIMAELLTAIPRSLIRSIIGHVTPDQQRALDRALMVVTGIA